MSLEHTHTHTTSEGTTVRMRPYAKARQAHRLWNRICCSRACLSGEGCWDEIMLKHARKYTTLRWGHISMKRAM